MQAGESKENIAKWLFVCDRTVTRVWNKFKDSGNYAPSPQNSGRKPLVSDEAMRLVVSKIKEKPDITLLELIDEFNFPISESALCKRLIKLGYSFKKRQLIRRSKTALTSKKNAKNL
jgi:transposase